MLLWSPLLLLLVGSSAVIVRNCSDVEEAFTAVVVGHTGFGKSTLIDVIAGGVSLAKTSSGGTAETEETSCYVMEYLSNLNPNIQGKLWRLIDTPGSADTGGLDADIHNQAKMTAALKGLGRVDAVFLVWKFGPGERFTPETMRAVRLLRLALGPNVWKRLIIIYTFVTWMQTDMLGTVSCQSLDIFKESEHKAVVKAIYSYLKYTLQVPEPLCAAKEQNGCFVDYSELPFIGSGSTPEMVVKYSHLGIRYFDPKAAIYAKHPLCENDAIQFANLYKYATSFNTPPLATSMVNMFVECERGLNDVQAIKGLLPPFDARPEKLEEKLRAAACHLSSCWSGNIGLYTTKAHNAILGNELLQVDLAFALGQIGKSELVQFSKGFQKITSNALPLYPSASEYMKCTRNVNEEIKQHCYEELHDFYNTDPSSDPEVCASRTSVLAVLSADVVCSCDTLDSRSHNSWTCPGFPELSQSCPNSYACNSRPFASLGQDPDYRKVCKVAATCESSVCYSDQYLDPTKVNYLCDSSSSCEAEECCLPDATCDRYTCSGTNSNYGSGVSCGGPWYDCNSDTCCYCSAWNIFDLGIGCFVFDTELTASAPSAEFSVLHKKGWVPAWAAGVLCLFSSLLISLIAFSLRHRCVLATQPSSSSEALLGTQHVVA